MLSFEVAFLQWVGKLSLQLLVGFSSFVSYLFPISPTLPPHKAQMELQRRIHESIRYTYYFLLDIS